MRRIPELDALRGLAALMIVAYHLWFLKFGFLGVSGWPALDALKLAVSLGLAAASWRLVERPLLALKGRFAYPGGPETTADPSPGGPVLDHLGVATT